MEANFYIAIGGLIIALVGMITTYSLQKENRKISDLQDVNKKLRNALDHSLNALEGYQAIEEQKADREGVTLTTYRKRVRAKLKVKHYRWITPSDIKDYKNIEE